MFAGDGGTLVSGRARAQMVHFYLGLNRICEQGRSKSSTMRHFLSAFALDWNVQRKTSYMNSQGRLSPTHWTSARKHVPLTTRNKTHKGSATRNRSNYSSSCPTLLYEPCLELSPSSPLVRVIMFEIHPPRPSPLLADAVLACREPSDGRPSLPSGGSMSSPGMAWSALRLLPPRRMSSDGTGERLALKRDSASARVSGVGIAVVASPKMAFISSRRTLAVSG
jgi:hypothetical protein